MLLHRSVARLLQESGKTVSTPSRQTPFDFVENSFQQWKRRSILERFGLGEAPTSRIPNDWIMPDDMKLSTWVLVGISAMTHPTFHLLGWNNHFPTRIEQADLEGCKCIPCLWAPVIKPIKNLTQRLWFSRSIIPTWSVGSGNDRADNTWRSRIVDFTMMVIGFFLVPSRIFIMVESCLSIRSLPSDAYVTVNWAQFIPHV